MTWFRLILCGFAVLFALGDVSADDNDKGTPEDVVDDPTDDSSETRHIGPDVSAFVGVDNWAKEISAALRVNADPVLRAIVCRVAYTDITPDNIIMATGMTSKQLKRGIKQLETIELVTTKLEGGVTRIAPASEEARAQLRKLADDWCASDDECGVAK